MNTSIAILFSVALATILSPCCQAFSLQLATAKIGHSSSCLFTTGDDDNSRSAMDNDDDKEENIDDMPVIAQSTVKIDDGGSDLTNRFKYKVCQIPKQKVLCFLISTRNETSPFLYQKRSMH